MLNVLKAACLAALVALPAPALAQRFSERTVRIIVPFAAGGGVDTIARLFAEKLQAKFGVAVIVENRAGGNGTLGDSTSCSPRPTATRSCSRPRPRSARIS